MASSSSFHKYSLPISANLPQSSPPPRPSQHHYQHPLEYLRANPNTSLDEFIARFASSTLEESPSPVSMSRQSSRVAKQSEHPTLYEKRQLWQPFPETQREAFTGVPPCPDESIIMHENYHLPGKLPVMFPLPYTPEAPLLLALDPLAPRLAVIDKYYHGREHKRMDDVVAEQVGDSNLSFPRLSTLESCLGEQISQIFLN